MHTNVVIKTATQPGQYLVACARIRDMSMTHLIQKLIDQICEDQLVLAVLDDEGKQHHGHYDRRFREVKDARYPTTA